jgi:ketosteroid isomerase-like protein
MCRAGHPEPEKEVATVRKTAVDRWLQAYVEAWKTYDRDQIGALFSEDVEYRYHPYDDPVRGRDAVVQSWLGESDVAGASTRDEEGTYDATYRTVAVDGDVAVATGRSTYTAEPGGKAERVFDNCFVMRFDPEDRCREFTEWFMEHPAA